LGEGAFSLLSSALLCPLLCSALSSGLSSGLSSALLCYVLCSACSSLSSALLCSAMSSVLLCPLLCPLLCSVLCSVLCYVLSSVLCSGSPVPTPVQVVFVLKYDPAESVSECGLINLDCVPRCDCDEGYVGSSCSLTYDEMLKEMDVRQLLVESLGALISVENPWKTNVKSWMNILSVVASDPLSLSDESKKLLTILAIEILKVAREVALSAEDLSEVGMHQVVDMSMSRLFSSISQSRGNTTTTEADLSTLLSLPNEYSRFVTSL
jgi:hypothetical protein